LVALLLLFGACEKEIPEGGAEGERVPILFSVDMGGYGAGGEMVRSAGGRATETVAIPLNDEVYLEATLMPDEEEETTFDGSQLRADEPFINGQKVRFVAYNAGTQVYTDSKLYSWSSGASKFIPDATPLSVVPDGTTVCRFIAYSYFGETGVAPFPTNIDPVHDLVWGKTATDQPITDTEASRTATIHMEHKFARVKVKVKSSISGFTIEGLSGVEIEGGKLASLNPFNGAISGGNAVTQGITSFTTISTTERESGYRTVLPVAAGAAKVKIGSVTVKKGNTTYPAFTNRVAAFSSSLDVAKSYTLVVDLKGTSRWARSNVVWDGSKLTFATTTEENAGIPANSQGLFFWWGSLVAIRPCANQWGVDYANSTDIIYNPTATSPSSWYSIGDIPKGDGSMSDAFDTYNNNTGFDAAAGKGDVCRYITAQGWVSQGNWRLPTAAEWEALRLNGPLVNPTTTQPWVTVYQGVAGNSTSNSYGFYQPATAILGTDGGPDNVANPRMLNVALPGSGYLDQTTSASSRRVRAGLNYSGNYYSSSASYCMGFYYNTNGTLAVTSSSSVSNLYFVRCIRSDI
jgi:hypothetical protein